MFSVNELILHLSIYVYEKSTDAHTYPQGPDGSQERNNHETEFWCWYVRCPSLKILVLSSAKASSIVKLNIHPLHYWSSKTWGMASCFLRPD